MEFTDRLCGVPDHAAWLASRHGQAFIGCEHVAVALLAVPGDTILSHALKRRGIDLDSLQEELERQLQDDSGGASGKP